MSSVLEQVYTDGHGSLVQEGSGRLLYDLVRRERLSRTAEVGLAHGGSALFICQALAENGGGLHTAIDPFQTAKYDREGVRNVARAGLSAHFRWIEAPSHAAFAERLAEGAEPFDLVFIDGSHKFDYALVDFFYADRLVRPGGFVAFDDLWMPGVLRVVNYVLRNRDYSLVPVEEARYSSARRRLARRVRRLGAGPLRLDAAVRRYGLNTCVLQKHADDARAWDFHRPF